jgi:hypothetical protein
MNQFIGQCQPTLNQDRSPISIDPEVRERLRNLLFHPAMQGVGYSAFINRACAIAEAEIVHQPITPGEAPHGLGGML